MSKFLLQYKKLLLVSLILVSFIGYNANAAYANPVYEQSDGSVPIDQGGFGGAQVFNNPPVGTSNTGSLVIPSNTLTSTTTWITIFVKQNTTPTWFGKSGQRYNIGITNGTVNCFMLFNDTDYPELLDNNFHLLTVQASCSAYVGGANSGYSSASVAVSNQNIGPFSGAWATTEITLGGDSSGQPYFILWESDVKPLSPPEPFDTSTHIIELTPSDHSFATSTGTTTDVVYNFSYYINENDIGQTFSVQVFLKNYDQNTLFGGFSDSQTEFLDFTATTSGIGGLTGFMTLPDGNYMIKGQLKKSLWGLTLPKVGVIDEMENQFIVGSSTWLGDLVQGGRNALEGYVNASSTRGLSFKEKYESCNPFSGSSSTLFFNIKFDPILCIVALVKPDNVLLKDSIGEFKDNVLVRKPWGYLTRVYTIFSDTSTSTLPTFTTTLNLGPSTGTRATTTLTFDMGDMITGGGTLLESIRDPYYNKSMEDVFGPLVKLVLALALLFTIISDLTGSHKHHTGEMGETKNKKLS